MAPHASHISLRNVTMETLPHLIELHSRVFPVSYGHRFYDEVLMAGDLAKMSKYFFPKKKITSTDNLN